MDIGSVLGLILELNFSNDQFLNPFLYTFRANIFQLKKGKKPYSIFKFKCPRCHEGDLFPTRIMEFTKFFDMNKRCSYCNLHFTPEPGFYYGAMFISYIITAIFFLAFVGVFILVFGFGVNQTLASLFFVTCILFVYIFRLSRSIWINMMIHYNQAKVDEVAAAKHIKD